MQFRTQVPISKSNCPIDYHSGVVSLGSCFAVNISEKFDYYKFRNTVNPFGILFHPPAIEKLIRSAAEGKTFSREDIFYHNGSWHCFDAHSGLASMKEEELLGNLNAGVLQCREALIRSTHVIITLGTSWVYRFKENGAIVANCHKVAQQQFEKELLPVPGIIRDLEGIISGIRSLNQDAGIIFTVSPVRHIRDGFIENQWSKANLITAIHEMRNTLNPKADYFPSYEIMMDELRDYRFYAPDMLHPNQTAIDYIWERFSQAYLSEPAFPVMEEIASIQKSLSHRPFNPGTRQHKEFLARLRDRISAITRRYPHIRF